MILFLGLPISFFLFLKSFLFFNSIFLINNFYLMLISVSFLVFISIYFFNFFFLEVLNKFLYFFIFILIFFFMNLCFMCDNYYLFIFFFEFSAFPMIYLILNFSFDNDSIMSSMFMFVMNLLGSLPFMFSFSSIYFVSGSFLLFFDFWSGLLNLNSISLFFFFYLVFIFKLPLMFFHFWLPKAHVSASGPSSIVLASLMLKMGSLGLFKFFFLFFFIQYILYIIMSPILGFTFLFLSFSLFRHVDLKFLVAISSVIHMTPLPFMLVFNSFVGIMGSVLFMIGHGLISCMLFFLVTIFYEQSFSRSVLFLKGLDKVNKIQMIIFLAFMILNFGFPPFMSFLSEFFMGICCFFFSLDLLFFFCFYMVICNLIFMIFATKSLVYKMDFFNFYDFNLNFVFLTFLTLFIITYFPFIF